MDNNNADRPLSGLKVCLCTPDYVYMVKNGGIGTSFHHTARILRDYGAKITILYANSYDEMSDDLICEAVRAVRAENCEIEFLYPRDSQSVIRKCIPNDIFIASAYCVYERLKDRDFDLIIFPDWRGLAYYCVHAKRQGLSFQDTQLWIQAHSTALWHELNNQRDHFDVGDVRLFHLERKSIEYADRLLPATKYLFDWMKEHGFKFPNQSSVMPLLIDDRHLEIKEDPNNLVKQIEEIVFFGRLERRKGLHLFLEAIQRIYRHHAADVDLSQIRIVFLGKLSDVDGESAALLIERMLDPIAISYVYQPGLSSDEAIGYLSSRNALSVMPSLTDNSPMTVHECILAGIPFIAADTGGIPEIVAEEDHAAFLVPPNSPALAERMVDILKHGQGSARPGIDQNHNRELWIKCLRQLRADVTDPITCSTSGDPSVSICLTHYERPEYLKITLDGLRNQTYKNFDIIIADNGSMQEESNRFLRSLESDYSDLSIKIVNLPDLYAGAARNRALMETESEFVIFMDDDNYAHPRQVERFVEAISESDFDALSCMAIIFDEDQDPTEICPDDEIVFTPTGCGISLNLFENSYGDANGIYRSSAIRSIGGFTEERLSWEDYELFSKLEQNGFKTGVLPERLLYLRMSKGGVSRRGSMLPNYYRALRPALAHFPWGSFGDALLVAISSTLENLSKIRFEDRSAGDDDLQLRAAQHSGDGVRICRMLAKRAYARGDVGQATRQLSEVVIEEEGARVLQIDRVGIALAEKEDLHPLALSHPLAMVVLTCTRERSLRALADYYSEIAERGKLSSDECYLQGLAELSVGNSRRGLDLLVRAADEQEEFLRLRYPDLDSAVHTGKLLNGLSHYLEYGQFERRDLNYSPPVRHLFATTVSLFPPDLLDSLRKMRRMNSLNLNRYAGSLLTKCFASGSVLGASLVSRQFLDQTSRKKFRFHMNPFLGLRVRVSRFY